MVAKVPSQEVVVICCTDLSGLVRGRGIAFGTFDAHLAKGVGWVPANQAITAFGPLAADNPWGSSGDLRLLPDEGTRTRLEVGSDLPPLHFCLSDVVEPDGSPWEGCLRTFLQRALEDLERHGLRLVASFEHEFQLEDGAGSAAPGFTLRALRGAEPFPSTLFRAAADLGFEPENVLAEYGPRQFELTVRPNGGLAAADRAAALREVVREVAVHCGWRATFSPITDPLSVGNGVHLHLSLTDLDGIPVTYDASSPLGLSRRAASFAAGILHHLPALVAVTAPSPVSYLRLTPHRWSTGYACLGVRNREAAVRVAPIVTLGGGEPAEQANIEYRPADATANPYLLLGMLVRAGTAGVERDLPAPSPVNVDPAWLDEDELRPRGVTRLPGSLAEALERFEADEVAWSWLPTNLRRCFVSMKRTELDLVDGLSPEQLCRRYADVY